MKEALKIYTADHELSMLLKATARSGERVRVKVDEETYVVRIEPDAESKDIWADYDPEQVRAAVRRSAAMGSSAQPADLDPIIAEIRAQRDQAPRRPHS